jgi:hypothetical protein
MRRALNSSRKSDITFSLPEAVPGVVICRLCDLMVCLLRYLSAVAQLSRVSMGENSACVVLDIDGGVLSVVSQPKDRFLLMH